MGDLPFLRGARRPLAAQGWLVVIGWIAAPILVLAVIVAVLAALSGR